MSNVVSPNLKCIFIIEVCWPWRTKHISISQNTTTIIKTHVTFHEREHLTKHNNFRGQRIGDYANQQTFQRCSSHDHMVICWSVHWFSAGLIHLKNHYKGCLKIWLRYSWLQNNEFRASCCSPDFCQAPPADKSLHLRSEISQWPLHELAQNVEQTFTAPGGWRLVILLIGTYINVPFRMICSNLSHFLYCHHQVITFTSPELPEWVYVCNSMYIHVRYVCDISSITKLLIALHWRHNLLYVTDQS